MLQKDPIKRITPEDALLHPYFVEEVDDEDQIPIQGCDLLKKMKSIVTVSTTSRRQSISSIMSSFHSHSNADISDSLSMQGIQKDKFKIKDSCVSFQGMIKDKDQESKQKDLREVTPRNSRIKKRVSRFSHIKEPTVL